MKHAFDKVRSLLERSGPRFVGIRPTGTLLASVEAVAPDAPR
jgi:hypothetical protein